MARLEPLDWALLVIALVIGNVVIDLVVAGGPDVWLALAWSGVVIAIVQVVVRLRHRR